MIHISKLLMLATVFLTGAATAIAQEKGDMALLQGKWKVTRIIKRGALFAEDRIAGMSFEFTKDKLTLLASAGQDKRNFSFKIDSAKKPKHLDLIAEGGNFNGVMVGGIFQLDGDKLLVCIPDDANTVRPDAFESLGGVAPSRSLFTLQRIKE